MMNGCFSLTNVKAPPIWRGSNPKLTMKNENKSIRHSSIDTPDYRRHQTYRNNGNNRT
jgi:hypothetical protein